jgi:hypothetical protein
VAEPADRFEAESYFSIRLVFDWDSTEAERDLPVEKEKT